MDIGQNQTPKLIRFFEQISGILFDRGSLSVSSFKLIDSLENYWKESIYVSEFLPTPGFSISAMQHTMYTLIRQFGTYATFIPPGVRIRNHPMVQFITPVGDIGPNARSVELAAFVVRENGIRAGLKRIMVLSGENAAELRAATVVFCRTWNEPSIPFSSANQHLDRLKKALHAFQSPNDRGILRDLVMETGPVGELPTISTQLFGAAWDLLNLITENTNSTVAKGLWNDYTNTACKLRQQASLIGELTLLMLSTSAAQSNRLLIALDTWLSSIDGNVDMHLAERLGRIIFIALKEWHFLAAQKSADLLTNEGYLRSNARREQCIRSILGHTGQKLPDSVARRSAKKLLSNGCWGHANALFKSVERSPADALPIVFLTRRLQGLRICGGYTISQVASRLSVSEYKLKRLITRLKPPSVRSSQVLTALIHQGNLPFVPNSEDTVLEELSSWLREEKGNVDFFDQVTILCPNNDQENK